MLTKYQRVVMVREHQQLMVDFLPAVLSAVVECQQVEEQEVQIVVAVVCQWTRIQIGLIEDPSGRDGNNHIYFKLYGRM